MLGEGRAQCLAEGCVLDVLGMGGVCARCKHHNLIDLEPNFDLYREQINFFDPNSKPDFYSSL